MAVSKNILHIKGVFSFNLFQSKQEAKVVFLTIKLAYWAQTTDSKKTA